MSRNNVGDHHKHVREEDRTNVLSSSSEEDSSTSSSTPVHIFDSQALIMELHELQREELPDNSQPEAKTRKFLRKRPRRPEQDVVSVCSNLNSLVGSTVHLEPPSEEFFDARESYHGLPAEGPNITSVSNVNIPKSIEDKSKTSSPSPSPEEPNKTSTSPPLPADPSKTTPSEPSKTTPSESSKITPPDSNKSTLESKRVSQPTIESGTKARSPLIMDEQDDKLQTAVIRAQSAPDSTSRQTENVSPATQPTGPLTKPTESTNP